MINIRTALAALALIAASAPARGDVVISTGATQNMSCSGGTCVPTAASAMLNAGDLENNLSQFGNVRVMTTGNGVEANNIVVRAAFSSPDSTSLTLEAHKAITVNAAVSIGSGTAELELQSDTLDTTDALSFGRKGHITFGSLSDIFGINGGIFTLVSSVQALAAAVAANPSGAFALANDYDASGDGTYRTAPIWTSLNGVFDGLGNKISGVSIHSHRRTNLGFFAQVGTQGVLKDLRLTKLSVRDFVGAQAVGGLVGSNAGTVIGDNVSGVVSVFKGDSAGGFVGYNSGTIRSSGISGRLHAPAFVSAGGLAGYNAGVIDLSYATNVVDLLNGDWGSQNAGGLVGSNYGTISQSFATGDVTGLAYGNVGTLLGGLIGWIYMGTVSNSYATGSVTGYAVESGDWVGGFAGNSNISISGSYSTGMVYAQYGFLGGFLGSDSEADTDCYWDTTTSGTDTGVGNGSSSGITGLTTQQFQSGLPTGFDPKIWAENPNINGGLPYLINNPPPK